MSRGTELNETDPGETIDLAIVEQGATAAGLSPSDRRDQAVATREQAAGERERAVELRERAAELREEAVHSREVAADDRDSLALGRDRSAERRDEQARKRDVDAVNRDEVATEAEQVLHLPEAKLRALAETRSLAAADRTRAHADRRFAAGDRTQAGADRVSAEQDRTDSSHDRANFGVDELTEVLLRGPGLIELDREVSRAMRTNRDLTVAFIDVDGLKDVNDTHGHGAGDELLLAVANSLRTSLRPYDTIIRFGGDEFVCALSDTTEANARTRFATVNDILAARQPPASVTVGLAQLHSAESTTDIVARADADLYAQRQAQRGGSRPR